MNKYQKSLRLKCLAYIVSQYDEWPAHYEGSVRTSSHCGYSWTQEIDLESEYFLKNRESGDVITKFDWGLAKIESAVLGALPENCVVSKDVVYSLKDLKGVDVRVIGNFVTGESLLVVEVFQGVKLSLLLIDEEQMNYKRVL